MTKRKPHSLPLREIGRRIKAIRTAHDLTLAQFAKKIGKHENTICGLERAKHMADVGTLLAISMAFGIGLDQLLAKKPRIAILRNAAP